MPSTLQSHMCHLPRTNLVTVLVKFMPHFSRKMTAIDNKPSPENIKTLLARLTCFY